MYKGQVTIRTTAGNYRIPINRIGSWKLETTELFGDLFGDLVDRLGMYEDCKTLDEMNKARRRFGLPEIKK